MQIIQDRRALHQIPEVELSLPKTMAYVKESLAGLRCSVVNPVDSALCAFFDFGHDSAIAFRADMDALPVQEVSDKPYISFCWNWPGVCRQRKRFPGMCC